MSSATGSPGDDIGGHTAWLDDGAVVPVIDTHVHLWDLAHPRLRWDWVDTDADHPILGEIDAVKMRAFEMHHLEAEARACSVASFVHVQAAIGSPDPVDETRWLTEQAARHPRLGALIAHADLGHPTTAAVLDAHGESPIMRGVRDFALEPYLASGATAAAMERSLADLARRGLVLDADCEFPNMAALRALAERHAGLTIVLEHIGFPRSRDNEYAAAWRRAITDLATAPNVVCKISGIAMTAPGFRAEELRPWFDHCLEAFGPDRCLLGSNWPLDRIRSSYDTVMGLYRHFLRPLGDTEQAAVLHRTARRVYRPREGSAPSATVTR